MESFSESTEIVLHELGNDIAASVASIQRELSRYPNTLGAFLLDEMELDIPVSLRVDDIGRLMVTVVANDRISTSTVGKIHLKLKPVLGASEPPAIIADQSLEKLRCLSIEDLKQLNARRIFTVEDLLRATTHAAGRQRLSNLGLSTEVEQLRNRAFFLSLHDIPPEIIDALFQVGLDSPIQFLYKDAGAIASELNRVGTLSQSIDANKVSDLQKKVKNYLGITDRASKNTIEPY